MKRFSQLKIGLLVSLQGQPQAKESHFEPWFEVECRGYEIPPTKRVEVKRTKVKFELVVTSNDQNAPKTINMQIYISWGLMGLDDWRRRRRLR
jgi:hypothetical protein